MVCVYETRVSLFVNFYLIDKVKAKKIDSTTTERKIENRLSHHEFDTITCHLDCVHGTLIAAPLFIRMYVCYTQSNQTSIHQPEWTDSWMVEWYLFMKRILRFFILDSHAFFELNNRKNTVTKLTGKKALTTKAMSTAAGAVAATEGSR